MESIKVVDLATDQIVKIGDLATNSARVNIVAGGAGGGTSSSFGAAFPATGTAAGAKDTLGNMAAFNLDAAGNLKVVTSGGAGGGPADVAANVAASETDTARQKVTSAVRWLDVAQPAGSQLVIAKGDQTSGLWVNLKAAITVLTDPIDRSARLLGVAKIVDTLGVNQLAITAANAAKVDGSAVIQPVSGTVTSNIGTTGGLALDATLTAGNLVAIVKTLAKGTTAAGNPTSVATDANTQSLHTNVTNFPATQTVTGTVTANQGTAAAVAGSWPIKLTDGTNTTAVKAASTAAVAADPSVVVALSPNSPLPTGTNVLGAVTDQAFRPANTNVATNTTFTVTTNFTVTVPSGARYVSVVMFVTGVVSGTAPTLAVAINQQEPQSGNFISWLVSPNLTVTNTGTDLIIGPAAPSVANASFPGVLGTTVQIQAVVGGTAPSFAGVNITLVWSS